MFSKVLLCCLFAYVICDVVVEPIPAPEPYSFGFDHTDELGTRVTRQETSDANNNKVGSYSYVDPNGITRAVSYVADALGFRANIDTNEPGTKTSAPADVSIVSSAEVAPTPVVVKATPVVTQVLQPAPVAVKAVHPGPVVVKAVDPAPFSVHAVPAPITYAHHPGPITYAHHPAPITYAHQTAPIVYAQRPAPWVYRPQVAPWTYPVGHAPFPYTVGRV